MNLETEKDDCVQSIIVGATRTADWRDKMLEKYGDQRNGWASKALRKIAVDAENLDDESWRKLQPYFASDDWREGVSEAARRVGFAHRSKSLPFFVKTIVSVLSQPVAA